MIVPALFATLVTTLVAPQSPQIGWYDLHGGRPVQSVKRVTDELPLSDQTNTGHWAAYPAVWDEFNGASLDRSKWNYGIAEWHGPQPCWYSDANVAVKGGNLLLTLKYDTAPENLKAQGYNTYSGAGLTSKTKCLYGYYEARAKVGDSQGSSAFWFHCTEPTIWTEIDVFEISGAKPGSENTVHQAVHVFKTPAEERHWQVHSTYVHSGRLADEYHVYGLEWTPSTIIYYFDGVPVRRGPNTHWHQPLYLNFDHDILKGWFGLPRPSDLPSVFSVDYVRAWKKGK